jgi:hypothetical protein
MGERGADHLPLNPDNDDGRVHHRGAPRRATKYDCIVLSNLTANLMPRPKADPTRRERRDRDRIEGLAGVEGIQQARQQDGMPTMTTAHKINLKDVVTGPAGDGAGVAAYGIPVLGQYQRACNSALPAGDDPVPVLVEVDLGDHHGV